MDLDPIKQSAVELRLNPMNWPADLDSQDLTAIGFSKALQGASTAYSAFQDERQKNMADAGLTPLGARVASGKWAEGQLPALRERLSAVRENIAEKTASFMAAYTKSFTAPAEEPHDIALLQEVRTWLRSLPEQQRAAKVLELARKGDRTALRAVLTAPAYLTGVAEDQLYNIREIVIEADHPERFAKFKQVKAAAEVAERALDGVIRFVEQETAMMTPPPPAGGMLAR